MSTDPPLPDPGDSPLPERLPDPPAEPDEEPLLVEPADEGHVFVAELAEPHDKAPPRRRRPVRLAGPPAPPHPGFWWAVGWCLLLLLVAQIAIPLPVLVVILLVEAVRLGGVQEGLNWLVANQADPALVLPLQALSHAGIFLMALLALRFAAGKDWARQVALRLPAVVHVMLAVVGATAFWLLSAGIQLTASRVLPSAGDLPSCVAVAAILMLIVGGYWLAVRVTTGRDWVRDLAAAPLRTQVILGPLGVLLLLVVGVQTYQLVSPYIFRIPQLDGDFFAKTIEKVLQGPWWATLLVVAATPMFSEEFWCRAFLGRGLVGRHGLVMGIIWTSLFFGAIHLFPQQAAMAAILGIVLHSAYVASRSLMIPMLMHFLNNALGVLSYKLLEQMSPELKVVETDPEQLPGVWFVAAAFLAAAVLWAFYTSRGRLVRTDGSNEPPWQPPFAGVAHPPPGSGTEVVYPWPGVLPTLAVIAGVVALGCALFWA